MSQFPIYVFDAYGTLFDVHSAVAQHRDAVGAQADRLSDMWRTKQLEYTWVRTLMGAHKDFAVLTAQALDHSAARCGVTLSPSLRQNLLNAYDELKAFPDAVETLQALRAKGAKTAILSNGTPEMLHAATQSSGLAPLLDAVLSIETLGKFKTVPEVYALVTKHFDVAPAQVSFQSSNRWDVAAGVKFGFRTVWINRTGQPEEYTDLAPQAVVGSLSGLVSLDA